MATTIAESNTKMERTTAKTLYIALVVAVALIVAALLFQSRRTVEVNSVAPVAPMTEMQRTLENSTSTTNEVTPLAPARDFESGAIDPAPANP